MQIRVKVEAPGADDAELIEPANGEQNAVAAKVEPGPMNDGSDRMEVE